MNTPDGNCRFQQPPHRRKTPSFSSSLLDSILRSIDETNGVVVDGDRLQAHDQDLMIFAEPEPKQIPSLRRAIMIDQWMETLNNNKINRNNNGGHASRKVSSDSVSSCGTTTTATTTTTTFTSSSTSSETETPSTYRSLPNSFTISRKTAEAVFRDDKREGIKFMKSTKLRAMKIYGDLKKVKQPISPGGRFSAFIHSLFASSPSSSKKKKANKSEESMQNFRTLKKSRSIKQDATMTCTSFSRSCMSKKQHTSSVKRSVRFYPENDTVFIERDANSTNSTPFPKYERQWFTEKNYTRNYRNFKVNVEEDDDEDADEDEDDLFELEIVGGVGTCNSYRQELPVFETTDLRKIRI